MCRLLSGCRFVKGGWLSLSFDELPRRTEFVPRIRLDPVLAHLRSFDSYDRISVVLSQDDEPSVSGTGAGVSSESGCDGVFSGSRRFSPSAGRECVGVVPGGSCVRLVSGCKCVGEVSSSSCVCMAAGGGCVCVVSGGSCVCVVSGGSCVGAIAGGSCVCVVSQSRYRTASETHPSRAWAWSA